MTKKIILYVSIEGNDKWSGKLEKPNNKRTDGPLASIKGAREVLRKMRKNSKAGLPVEVIILPGTYKITAPVVFKECDSGTEKAPVVFTGRANDKPVVSGGVLIKGWKKTTVNGKKMFVAPVPDKISKKTEIGELFVNDERRNRPRLPKGNFYRIRDYLLDKEAKYDTPQDSFGFAGKDIKQWKNLADVEVVVLHFWAESHLKIKRVDLKKKIVYFQQKSRRRFKEWEEEFAKYYIENVFEEISEGEWYYDKKLKKIYYMPLEHESLHNIDVCIPVLKNLLSIEGEPGKGRYVKHLHFENIVFENSTVPFAQIAASVQAAAEISGAIRLFGAQNCSILNCEIRHIGNYGIELLNGSVGNSVCGNHIFAMGAGGIKLNGSSFLNNKPELTQNNIISNNHIHDGGKTSHCAVGILVMHSGGNTVSHNHIHDLYYTGISVGWVWGYAESVALNNLIQNNHIHDLGKGWLSDMGGIYTLGNSAGTVLRHNLIHDINCNIYGGWGIYFDEGTADILAEDNIVYNCQTGGFHQHYGRDNMVRNNIFGPSIKYHIQRTRVEEHISFIFKNNIFYIKGGEFLKGDWQKPRYIFDGNIYWRADGKKLKFDKWTFKEWQERGHDLNSLVADPMFKNPQSGDYSIKPDSPALKMGFKQIEEEKK